MKFVFRCVCCVVALHFVGERRDAGCNSMQLDQRTRIARPALPRKVRKISVSLGRVTQKESNTKRPGKGNWYGKRVLHALYVVSICAFMLVCVCAFAKPSNRVPLGSAGAQSRPGKKGTNLVVLSEASSRAASMLMESGKKGLIAYSPPARCALARSSS